MIVFAVLALILSVFNVMDTVRLLNGDRNLHVLINAAADETGGGITGDLVLGITAVIMYVSLAVAALFNIMKIVIGVLGLQKADVPGTDKFFLVWGVVFLAFGVFGISGLFSLAGVCNLGGGIAAPILFVVFSKQNRAPGP